jgi:hypothetical protein
MIGTGVTAAVAVGLLAGFSAAPAFASTQDHGERAPSHEVAHFNGEAFTFEVAPEFKPIFVPGSPEVQLSHGATFLKDGVFRLGGGPGTVRDGHVTENLRGTFFYSASEGGKSITIKVTNFQLETVVGHHPQSEVVGDVVVSGSFVPHTIKEKGADLIDLQDNRAKVSVHGHTIEFANVPATLSTQASQAGGGILPPHHFLGVADFSVPTH